MFTKLSTKKRITLYKRKDSFPVVSIVCLYDPHYQYMLYDSWLYPLAALYLVLYAIIALEFNINQCWRIHELDQVLLRLKARKCVVYSSYHVRRLKPQSVSMIDGTPSSSYHALPTMNIMSLSSMMVYSPIAVCCRLRLPHTVMSHCMIVILYLRCLPNRWIYNGYIL